MRRTVGFICIFLLPVCQLLVKWFAVPGLNIFDGGEQFLTDVWKNISSMTYGNAWMVSAGGMAILSFIFLTFPGYDLTDKIIYKILGTLMVANVVFANWNRYPDGMLYRGLFPINPSLSDAIHCGTGFGIFVLLGLCCVWLFRKHDGEVTDKKKLRNTIYLICGIVVFTGVALTIIVSMKHILHLPWKFLYWKWWSPVSEYFMLGGSGVAWLIKGESIKILND